MSLQISLFDRLPYDDLEAYGRFGKVRVHTRYNGKLAADADVIFTTYSRPPDIDGLVVNLASTDDRHLGHLKRARILLLPPWNRHQVATWTITRVQEYSKGGRVAILGRGQIGRLVFRFLRASGHDVELYSHHELGRLPPCDVISLHLRQTEDNRGCADPCLLRQNGTFLINSARRGLISDAAMLRAIESGRLRGAAIDGGKPFPHSAVVVTPHVAWQGSRSELLRPRRVLGVLEQLAEGKQLGQRNPARGFGL